MINILRAQVLLCVVILTGCTHTIVISPKMDTLATENETKINKNVGYYISKVDLNKKVTTPGGGKTSVEYMPYRDLESALYKTLLSVYQNVYKLEAAHSASELEKNDIAYVFVPDIRTASSSPRTSTWPPSNFSVLVSLKTYNADGKLIWHRFTKGKGYAEPNELEQDPQLAARRASKSAFEKMQKEMTITETIH